MSSPRQITLAALALVAVAIVAVLISDTLNAARAVRVDAYQRSGDPHKIIAVVTTGIDDQIVEASAREDERTVTLTVRVRYTGGAGARILIGIALPIVITLRQPLGDRAVMDASGSPARDLGFYQPFAPPR